MLWTHEAQPSESKTNSDHYDDEYRCRLSTDDPEPHSICFLPQYSTSKKMLLLERDQDRDTTKEQALSITVSQSDCFISQNERF